MRHHTLFLLLAVALSQPLPLPPSSTSLVMSQTKIYQKGKIALISLDREQIRLAIAQYLA